MQAQRQIKELNLHSGEWVVGKLWGAAQFTPTVLSMPGT
jgi:hypothetical protein